LRTFLTINGTVSSGENYVKLIQNEFKIQSWELFVKQVKDKLVEGAQYYIENKDYDILSNTYGKPSSAKIDVELSVDRILEILNSILINVINKYLPNQTIQEDNILTHDEQITLDATKEILKTISSGTTYQTDALQNKQPIVRGCMDKNALNYNPLAQEDDGSCIYESANLTASAPKQPLPPNAPANSTPTETQTITKVWYGWADVSTVTYKNKYGQSNFTKIYEYAGQEITYIEGSLSVDGDIREIKKETPSVKQPEPVYTGGGGSVNYYSGGSGGYGSGGDSTFSNVNYLGNKDNMFNIQ
jgi:hypothetical protein